jgi:hypothetical protein
MKFSQWLWRKEFFKKWNFFYIKSFPISKNDNWIKLLYERASKLFLALFGFSKTTYYVYDWEISCINRPTLKVWLLWYFRRKSKVSEYLFQLGWRSGFFFDNDGSFLHRGTRSFDYYRIFQIRLFTSFFTQI